MKFCRLVKYDLKNGILPKIYKYLITFVMGFIIIFAFRMIIKDANPTITNMLFYLFQGKEPFEKDISDAFVFPIVWLIIYILGAYITLEYPFDNMTGHGLSVIVRIKNRSYWWASKCIYTTCSTLLYFVMWYMGALIASVVSGAELSFTYSDIVNMDYISIEIIKDLSHIEVVISTIILPVLTGIAFNMIMLCLQLYIDRLYCFWIVTFYIFAATYFKTPFLIGNFAMLKRSAFCIEDGYSLTTGICVELLVIVVCITVGLIRIRKYDILNKEN